MGGWRDGWKGGWRNGWIDGYREKVRGVYRFSSLVKQNKKAKICFVIHIAGFFFKKNSVMKCLRSKKRQNAPPITTKKASRGPLDGRSSFF
jgi:hypothetical protein